MMVWAWSAQKHWQKSWKELGHNEDMKKKKSNGGLKRKELVIITSRLEKPGNNQIFGMCFKRPTEAQEQAKVENGVLNTFSQSMIAVRHQSWHF